MQTSLFIDNIEKPDEDRLLLFPTMTFQESGNISSWIFAVLVPMGESDEMNRIEFHVWSRDLGCESRMTRYRKIGQNTISMSDLKPTGFQNVYEYEVPPTQQIPVIKEDVFAVFQSEDSSISLVFAEEIGHLAYEPHIGDSNEGLVEFESNGKYFFPLVTFKQLESGEYL